MGLCLGLHYAAFNLFCAALIYKPPLTCLRLLACGHLFVVSIHPFLRKKKWFFSFCKFYIILYLLRDLRTGSTWGSTDSHQTNRRRIFGARNWRLSSGAIHSTGNGTKSVHFWRALPVPCRLEKTKDSTAWLDWNCEVGQITDKVEPKKKIARQCQWWLTLSSFNKHQAK